MPNDLTAKRNLLNARADAPTSQRQKLTSSGFTASIWTLSGVVLVACSSVEDFLGLDDGGGGGRAHYVQNSPVHGARLYFFAFDENGDGTLSEAEKLAQDEQYPEGFVTDASGAARNIPAEFYGKPFVAILDGAIDVETGAELSGELRSIANADDQHLLASPITEYIATQLASGLEPEAVIDATADEVAELLGLDPATTTLTEAQEQMRDTQIRAILSFANYQGGDARIEALAAYLAHTPSPDPNQITRILLGDTADPDNTLIVVSEDMVSSDAVTIGTHDSYVATIQAVSHAGGVGYRFVDANGEDTTISDFSINAQGVISFIGENPTTTTLHIEVSNDDAAETQIVRVEVTVADAPVLNPLPDGAESTTIAENVPSTDALISGITPEGTGVTATDFVIREAVPAGLGFLVERLEIVDGATTGTFNLALRSGETLDHEAIPGGVLNLHVFAENAGVRSAPLEIAITVTDANDAPIFQTAAQNSDLDYTAEIPENAAMNTMVAQVGAIDVDAGDNVTYEITAGNADGAFAIDNRGVIRVADASALDYDTTPNTYTLTVTATDSADATDTAMVEITLTDINDVIPTYTESGASDASVQIVTAAENTDDTSTGYSITITDADTNNIFSVSVSGDARDRFEFKDQGGGVWELFLKAGEAVNEPEDAEIRLTYSVSDGTNTAATTTAQPGSVTLDVVDTPVSFTPLNDPMALIAPENDMAWMLQLEATSDAGGSGGVSDIARYEFVDGSSVSQSSGIFRISDMGLITITSAFDFEDSNPNSYEFTVRATDSRTDPEFNEITFTITVENLDEGDAVFTLTGTAEAGETLTVMQTTPDPDGIVPNSINYIWRWEDATVTDPFAEDRFKTLLDENGDPHTGSTYTIPAGADLTNILGYEVSIEYTDNFGAEFSVAGENTKTAYLATSTVTFTANSSPFAIDEADAIATAMLGTAGDGVLATVTATSSENQDVSYALTSATASDGTDASSLFSVDSDDGEVRFADSSVDLDFESISSYTLTITASAQKSSTDTTKDTNTATVIINVGDVQEGEAEYAISESGDILTVALTDPDPASMTYSGDPDGVVGDVMFRWFTTSDGGMNKNYLGEASTSNMLDTSATPPMPDPNMLTLKYLKSTTTPSVTAGDEGWYSVTGDAETAYALDTNNAGAIAPDSATAHRFILDVDLIDDTTLNGGGGDDEYLILPNANSGLGAPLRIADAEGHNKVIIGDTLTIGSNIISHTLTGVRALSTDYVLTFARSVTSTAPGSAPVPGDAVAFYVRQPASGPDNSVVFAFEAGDDAGRTFTYAELEAHLSGTELSYGVEISYTDGQGKDEAFDVFASPIDFTDGTDSVSSYTGTINEDGTLLADNAGDDIPLPQVVAVVEDAPMGSTIKYAFLVNAETGLTTTSFLGFSIDFDDGTITASSAIPGTDFNYDLNPVRDSITLTVRATYDTNGANTGGDVHTRDVDVVITVNDLNDETPELGALQVDANAPSAVAGAPTLAGATTGIDTLTGTAGADHIAGGDGADEITSGGGNDHILGDAGNDEITLSTDADNVETIYYRFASGTPGAWTTTDGTDIINNFRRGEDRLVLIDTDEGSVIHLNAFTHANNVGSKGGQLTVEAIFNTNSGNDTIIGVIIKLGSSTLTINYATDSHEVVYDNSDGTYPDNAAKYLGENGQNGFPIGYDVNSNILTDNALLPNYFNVNAGDDNLQIIGTADIPAILGADIFISEKYTDAHGVFANLPVSDADGTSPNNAITSYDITGGTGANHFVLADDGDISVKAGATFDATEYTLIITATDGGDTPMTSDPKTITIGILEDSLAEYSLVQPNGQIAVMLDTADADGVVGTPSYQWFKINTDGTRMNVGTDTTTYTPPMADEDLIHGVIITYTDTFDVDAGTQTTVEALTTPIKFTDADGDIVHSYTAPVGEDAVFGDPAIVHVDASVDGASADSVITYSFRLGDNDFNVRDSSGIFIIGNNDGMIEVEDETNLDFETTQSYTFTVHVRYDADGSGMTTDDQVERNVQVIINVQDVNEHTPAFAPLKIVEDSGAVAGIPVAALTGLTGTAAAEHITGTTGDDTTITSGGGADHIFGDAGDDTITLSTDANNVETIYYRFSSAGSGAWVGSDGIDTIENFRRGEDRVVFIDTDGSPISRTDFLNNNNRGASGGQLTVKLLTTETMPTSATLTTVNGIEIQFDANNKLVLKYHSDTTPSWARASTGAYTGSEEDFIGSKGVGYDSTTKTLTNHGLLANYFNVNSGDDNLQVMGDDILTRLGADIAISEKYTNAHGVFAKLPASDDDGSAPNDEINYFILAGSTGRGVFDFTANGDIRVKAGATLDYDIATEYTLIIEASDGGSPSMTSDPKTITIGILEDSLAEYAITEDEASGELTVARISEDLDGVVGTVSYQWFKIETDGTRMNVGTDTTTYTPPTADADLIHGVYITYTDTLDATAGTETTVEALTTPIKITDADGDIVPSYTGTISEDAAANDPTTVTVKASVDNAPDGHFIGYAFVGDAQGFAIDATTGVITLDTANLDYESATQSYTLTVGVSYDADSSDATTDDQEIRYVQVIINVQDVNEFAPEFAPLAIVADSGAVAGIPDVTALTGLTGAAAAEHITGTTGMDTITSGGGADHIFGGAGNDTITLSTDANNVETVYYRFSSAGSGAWVGSDGKDEIHNFRRGEDRVVFIDTDTGDAISRTDFLNNNNRGASGGQLTVKLLATETPSSGVTQVTITGIEIQFDANNKLVLNYHSDITFSYNSTTGSPSATGLPFIGTNGAGYDSTTKTLTDHAGLLPNYFGDTGNTNLQVIAEADSPNFGGDILISERRRHEDGVFATLAATDEDGAPNNAVSYKITGGTGENLFQIDEFGGISVAEGSGFNSGGNALTYTLTIEASDSADTPMKTEETITIGVEVDVVSRYSFFVNNAGELEASLDTNNADSDGVVAASVMYQWFSTDGTSINLFGAPSSTNTLDRSSNPLPANSVYGVSVTYEDGAGNMEVFTTVSGSVVGTVATENINGHANSTNFIVGGLGIDTIDGKGGTAHIWGGEGNDIIKLTEAKGSVETIYYAFSSTDGAWTTTDGFDTITNFRRDEDRLIFVDEDETVITMTEFLNHDDLVIKTIEGPLAQVLEGVRIFFGTTQILEIQYHSSDQVRFQMTNSDWILEPVETYLGDLPGDDVSITNDPTGYSIDTQIVETTTLLPNYFNEETGQDNLQILDDEMIVILDLI